MKPDRLLDLRRITCLDVLARAGLATRPGARGWPCPVCGDVRQCRVERDIRRWACGRCHAYGDAGDLWLAMQGRPRAPRTKLAAADWECLEALLGGAVVELPDLPPPKPLMPRAEVQRWWQGMARCSPEVAAWCRWRGVEPVDVGAVSRPGQLPVSRPDLRQAGPSAAFPLRTVDGEVANVVIRPLSIEPQRRAWKPKKPDDEFQPWKARPLASGEGACRDGSRPSVYGDPLRLRTRRGLVLTPDRTTITGIADMAPAVAVLCEGAMDVASVRMICDLPVVGARAAGDLRTMWGPWLRSLDVVRWIVIPHCDAPTQWAHRGEGLDAMAVAVQGLSVTWWPWDELLARCGWTVERWRLAGRSDLNDLLRWWGRDRVAEAMRRVVNSP